MYKSLFHSNHKHLIQFVTFRTQESIENYLGHQQIKQYKSVSQQQFEMDKYLDKSNDGAILNDEVIPLLINLFKSNHNKSYNLIAVSIMPNHVHLLFEQLTPLSQIMQNIKGKSAFLINKHFNRSGAVWDKSYYDRAVRSEKQFVVTYQYIKNNAQTAKLADADSRFYSIYEDY